jgi:hypothetical protein
VSPDAQKIEALIAMAQRLTEAIEADIAALKAGRPQEMRTLDPDIQRLSAAYGREAASFDPSRAKLAPPEMRKRLVSVTARFHDALKLHNRLVTRMRNASEGLIRAIAVEVERQRAPKITYGPPKTNVRPKSVAMIFNGVV